MSGLKKYVLMIMLLAFSAYLVCGCAGEEAVDYGELKIESVTAWVDYPGSDFIVEFSNDNYKGEIEYIYDNTKLEVDAAAKTVRALAEGTFKVTARTPYHEEEFRVFCYIVDKSQPFFDTSKFTYKETLKEDWENEGERKNITLFIGDSFFDTRSFWSNFYSDLSEYKVKSFGIGSTTSYDWEIFEQELIRPYKPKNIVIHIGSNNVFDDNRPAFETVDALKRLFTLIKGNLPDTPIYFFGIPKRLNSDAKNAIVLEVNEKINQWCAKRDWITYLNTPLLIQDHMLKDGVHIYQQYYSIYINELLNSGIALETKN